jgi:hypothetical protein
MPDAPPPLPPKKRTPLLWILGAVVAAIALVATLFVSVVFGVLRKSEPYQIAVARVSASPAVIEALGTPIEEGVFVMGNIHVSQTSGQAQFEIPLHGPKGKGTAYVAAGRAASVWTFEVLKFEGAGRQIDLLAGPAK